MDYTEIYKKFESNLNLIMSYVIYNKNIELYYLYNKYAQKRVNYLVSRDLKKQFNQIINDAISNSKYGKRFNVIPSHYIQFNIMTQILNKLQMDLQEEYNMGIEIRIESYGYSTRVFDLSILIRRKEL